MFHTYYIPGNTGTVFDFRDDGMEYDPGFLTMELNHRMMKLKEDIRWECVILCVTECFLKSDIVYRMKVETHFKLICTYETH